MVCQSPEDIRSWAHPPPSIKDGRGQPGLPSARSGYREERDWSELSHHLHTPAKYIIVNVGGPCGEGSSPPMKRMGVGGSIVGAPRGTRLEWRKTPVAHIRWATTLWDVAPVGVSTGVKKLSLKGNREVRGRPPRCGAWVRYGKARPNEVDFNLR
jgi:hypothetical protein